MVSRAVFAVAVALPFVARAADPGPAGKKIVAGDAGADPFLPTLAVVGVEAPVRDDADGAKKLGDLLADMADWSGNFGKVVRPSAASTALGQAALDDTLRCGGDAACYSPAAAKLEVDRLVLASLGRDGISYRFRVVLYDRGLRSTQQIELESISLNVDELTVLLPEPYNGLLERAAAKRAKLTVVSEVVGARVALSEDEVGPAPVTRYVAAGTWTVRVEREGFATFEDDVALAPGETEIVEAVLPKLPPGVKAAARPAVRAKPGPTVAAAAATATAPAGPRSLTRHPGTYVAAVGVVAIAAGAVLGTLAKVTEGRAADGNGDGVRDITRGEAVTARSEALAANVAFAAGGALVAGGALWIVVAPPWAVAAPLPPSDGAPVTLVVGGRF